jgi:hypothetical protein
MNHIRAWTKRNLFYIIYFALATPVLIFCLRLHDEKWRHLNWIIGKCVCLFLVVISPPIYRIAKKEISIFAGILMACVGLLNLWLLVHRDIEKYKYNICQVKFGKAFNWRRLDMGTPVIPEDWHNKPSFDDSEANWNGKDSVIGHNGKTIAFTSDYGIDFERDNYNLASSRGLSRSISIMTTFAKGKGRDTISFDYSFGDSTKTITRQQADSIFAAEKIKKDY